MTTPFLVQALITYFGFLVALTLHEAAHAIVARLLGDMSPETASRATINPVPHVDIFGTLIFPILMLSSGLPFLFGWAKPTQIDSRYFKKLKRDLNLVAVAGPAFNFLIALGSGFLARFLGQQDFSPASTSSDLQKILFSVGVANIVIGVFNLIPFPQSDGWKILLNSLHYNTAQKLNSIAGPLSIVFLVLMIFGFFGVLFRPILAIYSSIFFAY